ncbi:asparaginase [Pseudonocardia eucalypti]|uniref:Asparaginase n=1 Tax=Pseudonocardia eucalypti TaxID=648755 RepID=A0ABP9RBB9_9PSEU|nr:L-asparaginase II [Pseudonocardia eucalypti]
MVAAQIVAEVVRSGFVEGRHHGSVVVTEPDGSVGWSLGQVREPMFPRSCHKPLQALGMLRLGLDLDGELLALAGSSHSGEPFHLEGVRRILAGAGLDESALRTPPAYPIDEIARDDWIRAGHRVSPITMNCSGKHAAMLATCVHNGWPTKTYRDPEHPLQLGIRVAIEDSAGEVCTATAVDGCGAPLLAISLAGLARAFGRFAAAPGGTPEGRVADAFREHPEWASGTRRDEAALMRATPGLICKGGAEAVFAVGLPDGRGIAAKIEDGASRARGVVIASVLRRLGVENETIRRQAEFPLLGGGQPVGAVRPAAALR